jgi:hypothetical protein
VISTVRIQCMVYSVWYAVYGDQYGANPSAVYDAPNQRIVLVWDELCPSGVTTGVGLGFSTDLGLTFALTEAFASPPSSQNYTGPGNSVLVLPDGGGFAFATCVISLSLSLWVSSCVCVWGGGGGGGRVRVLACVISDLLSLSVRACVSTLRLL